MPAPSPSRFVLRLVDMIKREKKRVVFDDGEREQIFGRLDLSLHVQE